MVPNDLRTFSSAPSPYKTTITNPNILSARGHNYMKTILATLGPSSLDKETIKNLTNLGAHVFRLNMSHVPLDKLEKSISLIHQTTNIPVCIDTEGAQIRTQSIKNGYVHLPKGAMIKLHHDEIIGDEENISCTPLGIVKKFKIDDILQIDFDLTTLRVAEINKNFSYAEVIRSGRIGSNKAAILSRHIEMPAITAKDRSAIQLAREMGIQSFALSFAGHPKDIQEMRHLVGKESWLISKIESRAGLTNLKEIIHESDAILIDRGDMSKEVSLCKIPLLQRRIISLAKIYATPVYVATNLLESMLSSRVPTRAEVNDVVSTILMGADGLVLAAETAVGQYPDLAVKMIHDIIKMCEKWTPNTNIEELLELEDENYTK